METTETHQFPVKEEVTIAEEDLNIAIKNEMEDEQVEDPSIEVKQDFDQNKQDEISKVHGQNEHEISAIITEVYDQNIEHDNSENAPKNQSDTQKDIKTEIDEQTATENEPFIKNSHSHFEKDNLKLETEINEQNIDTHIEKDNFNTETVIDEHNMDTHIENDNFKIETEIDEQNIDTHIEKDNFNTETEIDEHNMDTHIEKDNFKIETEIDEQNIELHIEKENFKTETEIYEQNIDLHIEKDNLKMETEIDEQNIASHTAHEPFIQNIHSHLEKDNLTIQVDDHTEIKQETESILPTNDDKMKQEQVNDGDDNMNLVSYEYPSFDDSMDSSEAAALFQVEACLSEETIKPDRDYDEKQDAQPKIIKEETDLTVTETHIISNKVINATSTVTSTLDGILQSQTTQTLVMQIQPVTQNMNLGHVEQILPTNNDDYEIEDYGETFQLNSITGNYLSLEQEAYGLLQKKKQKQVTHKIYQCNKCSKTYAQKRGMVRHYKIHDSIERREMGVLKGLKTKQDKKDQLTKESKLKIKKEIKQEIVKKEIVEKPRKEGYPCTCGLVFRRNSRMETCLKSHTFYSDTEFKCSSCDKKFKTNQELIYHRNHHHRKRYPCKFCPTNYHTQKALFKHLQIHQQVQLTEFKVIVKVNQGKIDLNCLICNETSASLPELKTHIMEDHKEPYHCQYCKNQTFIKLTEFINHLKKTHADIGNRSLLEVIGAFSKLVKAWKCDSCGLQFYEADKLAIHQMNDHTQDMKNEQHFQCEDCQRVFVSIQGLHSHRRMHHRPEETEVAEPEEVGVMCLECRKICKDMTALTSHMRLHSMDRKYPCKYCDFRFATPQKRKTHAEIHTGDMKYVCFICEYQCSSENRLKQHKISIKHLNMKEYLLTGKPLVQEEPAKKEKDRKKDSVKKKKKDNKKDREVNSDDLFVCDICGTRFDSEDAMSEHKLTHPFIEFPNEENPSRIFFK